MKITYSSQSERKRHYVPPVLGNGIISMQLDLQGCMKQQSYCGMTPQIVLAGKRYADQGARLIRFGYFDEELPGAGALQNFSQTLDLDRALCECICTYGSGLEVKTTVFCPAERKIIAIRKEFSRPTDYSFFHVFPASPFLQMECKEKGVTAYMSGTKSGSMQIRSNALDAQKRHFGEDNNLRTTLSAGKNMLSSAEIFIAFDEELPPEESFDSLLEAHCLAWEKYWSTSSVSIPQEDVMKMYMTSQYHLKISSTAWSVPTGLFASHWEGRYFAYDELYTHGALLSSGHFEEALKIDRFRFSILERAIRRACYKTLCPEENLAAHFPWETLEDGSEGAPDGFWMDRYIHMANVAFSAWESWCFTGDRALLETELYPLIRACAEYIRRSGVYRDSVKGPYIGKCTDMERFGEFIERPYSTTCGAIAAFRAASACAKILQKDAALQETWHSLAEDLFKSLPQQGDRYVPYEGCSQRSIAMYHGLFPYGVIPPSDPLQTAAIEDTLENFQDFAGQYFKGSTLSAWYAGVIATGEVRRGNWQRALQLIMDAAQGSTGCFYECFEVYEKQKLPWFTTASGALIRAVNELLQYGKEHQIDLWGKEQYSFELPRKKFEEKTSQQ